MAGHPTTPGRSVTSRALGILDAFHSGAPRLTLTEIAERSGTPLATTHRLLSELTDWGALNRRSDGRYEVGRKLWDLGLLAPVQLELRQVAAPFLHDLHTTIRDTVQLAVRDGLSALYVDPDLRARVGAGGQPGGHPAPPACDRGRQGAPGRGAGRGGRRSAALAAPADAAHRRRARPDAAGTGRGPPAPVRPPCEEMTLGAASLAVPVVAQRLPGTVVVAALGIVVPPRRRDLPRLVPVLEVAARGIGRELTRTGAFH